MIKWNFILIQSTNLLHVKVISPIYMFHTLRSYPPHQSPLEQHERHWPRSSSNRRTPSCKDSLCTVYAGYVPAAAAS